MSTKLFAGNFDSKVTGTDLDKARSVWSRK